MRKQNMKMVLAALCMGVMATSLLTGCVSTHESAGAVPYHRAVTTKLKADVDVGGKIDGKSSGIVILGLFTLMEDNEFADGVYYINGKNNVGPINLETPADRIKSAAAFRAINDNDADLIVIPRYTVVEKNYFLFKFVDVDVEGYKGNIVKFRSDQ